MTKTAGIEKGPVEVANCHSKRAMCILKESSRLIGYTLPSS